MRINILAPVHGFGLRRSTTILSRALRDAGCDVEVTAFSGTAVSRTARIATKLFSAVAHRPLYDVNIFIESVDPSWFRLARVNCFLPNQEWVRPETVPYLRRFDTILCKTRLAERIFTQLGYPTRFIGFTSNDQLDPRSLHDYRAFIHIAGSSMLKGTHVLHQTWVRHPEWPMLRIFWHALGVVPVQAANINWINASLDEQILRRLQNSHAVHLCFSEVEGFGHYIVEAMSCRALVLTTDAPPMNELVTPDRGILVPYASEIPMRFGTKFIVEPGAIEAAVGRLLGMGIESRRVMGERAREWYLQNDRAFRERVSLMVAQCVP